MNVWQPIETAPKDGTSIMSYPHFRVVHWEDDDCYPGPGWVVGWEDAIDKYITTQNVTHWMPLPEPPVPT